MKIVLIVSEDGWDAHKEGCQDISRARRDTVCPAEEYFSKCEVWYEANSDFLKQDGFRGAYDISFKGCTSELPAF